MVGRGEGRRQRKTARSSRGSKPGRPEKQSCRSQALLCSLAVRGYLASNRQNTVHIIIITIAIDGVTRAALSCHILLQCMMAVRILSLPSAREIFLFTVPDMILVVAFPMGEFHPRSRCVAFKATSNPVRREPCEHCSCFAGCILLFRFSLCCTARCIIPLFPYFCATDSAPSWPKSERRGRRRKKSEESLIIRRPLPRSALHSQCSCCQL